MKDMSLRTPRILVAVLIVIILVVGEIVYLSASRTAPEKMTEEYETYWQNQLISLGTKDIGQPIEGFDADLLIKAFPGFMPQDFQNVETLEGRYRVTGETIELVRNQVSPVSSAERAVSDDGYKTLLRNVTARLRENASTTAAIDLLIAKLNTAERIEVIMNEGKSALGVIITPLAILEDSRCPSDVQCIQAGTVRVRVLVSSGLGESTTIFTLNQPITTEAEEITLIGVEPGKVSTTKLEPSDYRFQFEVKRR